MCARARRTDLSFGGGGGFGFGFVVVALIVVVIVTVGPSFLADVRVEHCGACSRN